MSLKKILIFWSFCFVFLLSFATAQADDASSVQKVIDETYVQPEYIMGYSLSEEQKTQTLNLLGYNAEKDTKVKTLNTSSYAKIMNVADDPSLQLYSSVKIQKLGSNETLNVKIETPNNITKVTQDMYRNAAVTLGIQHAKITVAAPIAVTGESALAGIYYSLEENGATVSDESKGLAQEELNTLSGINAENKGKKGYDADKLNVALTDIKSAVADKGEKLSETEARKIVESTLKNYGLDRSMSKSQISLIVNFAIKLSKSEVIHTKGFKSSLSSLKNSIISKAQSTFKGLNIHFDANKALESGKGILTKIWQWLVNSIKGLFS
ncbi:DUF1002 domain-containing protein [Streptococcus macacae]|uniref:PF06207 family protein n=1 Tax=Streptococcus macacae NCTC 11558 TaxID=764298 RepID=G5JVB8_9STRE|nr:DUF1002 domain-containing protein [Streptococcus macacae]EHJ53136.1 hypothetical protein STRMA_0692 [Streptococcus macacae NCTC 11558]SUN78514.1 Extracellular protein [Streptococcus macacae NCTC 11558]